MEPISSDRSFECGYSSSDSVPYTMIYDSNPEINIQCDISSEDHFVQSSGCQAQSQEGYLIGDQDFADENQAQTSAYHLTYYSPRSYTRVRQSYMKKVMNWDKIIPEQPRKRHRHLFIFDWDDTLLCTSYIHSRQAQNLSEKDLIMLAKTDELAANIFTQTKEVGDIVIVTNAQEGWVQHSAAIHLPKTADFIKENRISIISARTQFSNYYPNQVNKWKISAFQKLYSQENRHVFFDLNQLVTNIICVGDSTLQMQAGQVLAKSFQNSLLKTVKFRENPRIEELVKQQDLFYRKIEQIVKSPKSLTIKLERKKTNERKNE